MTTREMQLDPLWQPDAHVNVDEAVLDHTKLKTKESSTYLYDPHGHCTLRVTV